MRNWLATEFIRSKVDPEQIRIMLGHADLATTSRYLHLDNGDVSDTVRSLYAHQPLPDLDGDTDHDHDHHDEHDEDDEHVEHDQDDEDDDLAA